MEYLTSPKIVKELMNRHGFRFSKGLGQNFLIDRNILMKVMEGANIQRDDMVLEIGPGIGTLTRELADRAGSVVAVEIDNRLFPILNETLADCTNVKLIHGDILKLDIIKLLEECFVGQTFKVVANLPYYITTPIIMMFLEGDLSFETMVIMVQKEVAHRFVALPGTGDYGVLSIAVQYYTCPEIIGIAPASVFMPSPKVDSAIVVLNKRDTPPVNVKDSDMFFRVVKAAFGQRRKTLLNALTASKLQGKDKKQLEYLLNQCNIDPKIRGEDLTIGQYASIANALIE